MICYYGRHYVAIFYSSFYEKWLIFDDKRVNKVGAWSDVKDRILRGKLQPTVLFYEVPEVSAKASAALAKEMAPAWLEAEKKGLSSSAPPAIRIRASSGSSSGQQGPAQPAAAATGATKAHGRTGSGGSGPGLDVAGFGVAPMAAVVPKPAAVPVSGPTQPQPAAAVAQPSQNAASGTPPPLPSHPPPALPAQAAKDKDKEKDKDSDRWVKVKVKIQPGAPQVDAAPAAGTAASSTTAASTTSAGVSVPAETDDDYEVITDHEAANCFATPHASMPHPLALGDRQASAEAAQWKCGRCARPWVQPLPRCPMCDSKAPWYACLPSAFASDSHHLVCSVSPSSVPAVSSAVASIAPAPAPLCLPGMGWKCTQCARVWENGMPLCTMCDAPRSIHSTLIV